MLQLDRLFYSRAGDVPSSIFGYGHLAASRLPFNASQACIGLPASTTVHWPTCMLTTHPMSTTCVPPVIPMNLPRYPRASPSTHGHGPLLTSYGRPPAGSVCKPTTFSSAILSRCISIALRPTTDGGPGLASRLRGYVEGPPRI